MNFETSFAAVYSFFYMNQVITILILIVLISFAIISQKNSSVSLHYVLD